MNNCDSANIDFDEIVKRVSENWIPEIIGFLEDLYKDRWLPSHDINHHQRVWYNAVTLSRSIFSGKPAVRPTFIDELIICCFFHDAGLLINPGEFHGKESKLLADRFLSLSGKEINFDTSYLLEAIEKHDDKNYRNSGTNTNLLLEILSLADDIDAFGAIGLYRYIEIYLVRGIEAEKIPALIQSNVRKRYFNLVVNLEKHKIETLNYTEKYQTLINLLKTNRFPDNPVLLVKWIEKLIVKPGQYPDIIIKRTEIEEKVNNRIESFKEKYLFEMSGFKKIQ